MLEVFTRHPTWGLFAGIALLLVIASLVGFVLNRRALTDKAQAAVKNYNARVTAWWAMIAILAVALTAGASATIGLFAVASFFALREFITLTPTRAGDYVPLLICFYILIPVQYALIAFSQYGTFAIFIPVYAFLLLPGFAALATDTHQFLERTAKIQWGVMIAVYSISYAPALLMLHLKGGHDTNVLLLFYLLLVVQISDVLQYVFGKLFGKTKLAPQVSPSKTVEGLIGGGLSAAAVGGALWWLTPFTCFESILMSLIIVAMGAIGGLTLSAVKRSVGAKDWGVMIEGHGGMLDRFDSICFAAPVFFHITRYFFSS